jgi:cob(I)alamin adenosyltransferase
MKIYTKTGDKGTSTLYTGERLEKTDRFFEALGTVDECNAAIGVSLAALPELSELAPLREQLTHIQHTLFDLGAALATPRDTAQEKAKEKTRFGSEGVILLEKWIDAMEETLPPLHSFILPGGSLSGAQLHLARTICRRAERTVIPLLRAGKAEEAIGIYLNRLSDYLFVASRTVNKLLSCPETAWCPHSIF